MQYVIPLADGSYVEGDASITETGTRNDTKQHYIYVVNGVADSGSLSIQYKNDSSPSWKNVGSVDLTDPAASVFNLPVSTTIYRFVIDGASGNGDVAILDAEEEQNPIVNSTDIGVIRKLTKAQYDALTPADDVMYVIVG